MRFRFTLTHRAVDLLDETEALEINEPDGWRDTILKLGRDKDFRSLIEFFDGSFIFYGDNGMVNGGIEFIKRYDLLYGADANLEMLIELTTDNVEFETVFSGQLDVSLAEEMMDNKIRVPIIRNNFWAKFYSRRDTPVDLNALVDLDSADIGSPVGSIDLVLPSQIITYYTEANARYSITYDVSTDQNAMLNWDQVVKEDIKLFSIARSGATDDVYSILGVFEAPYDGEYRIELKLTESNYVSGTNSWLYLGSSAFVVIQKTGNYAPDAYTGTLVFNGAGVDSWQNFDIDVPYRMYRGEQLAIALRTVANNRVTVFGTNQITWKTDCLLATTLPITLSGEQVIDGVLTSSDRVLVKNQGNQWDNGIYVSSAGAWARATDMDSASECNNIAVYVTAGDFQADSAYRQTQQVGTLGGDAIIWDFADISDERFKFFAGYDAGPIENYIKITAKTTYPQTQQPASLIHDAAAAILKSYGLGEDNPFYSEIMGSAYTLARQYDQDGCAWRYAILRGLQLRGYTLADKPFFLSFNEWWKGVNPILNLGLTYDILPGSISDPTETTIQALGSWADAGGPFPGVSWDYVSYGFPFVSVNGGGGTEGYTCGTTPTLAGIEYVFSTVIELPQTGAEAANWTVIWAILDASYNEIETLTFNYNTYGLKLETFNLTPATAGTYFALRVQNDAPTETKNIFLWYAESVTGEQFLLNPEFTSGSDWANEDSGTAWVITGGALTLSLASGQSQNMVQEFVSASPGTYMLLSERTLSNITIATDSIHLSYNFYDAADNLITGTVDFGTGNNTIPIFFQFDSVVAIAKIKIIAQINSGADIDVSIPFAYLYGPTGTEIIIIPEQPVIRVEEVAYFYDPDPSLNIPNIRDISRKYDNDKIFNKINIGYNTWKSEDIQGIDDVQTQHIYATRFEKVGQTITLWSDFIAAGLAIESTRRKTITESTDNKFDDSTFIIAINPDDVSPDTYSPELSENFGDIENLLDSDTRYNIRLSVARNFLRWRKWFNGCLQNWTDSLYRFVRGEGNYDMVSTMVETSPDCLDESYDNQPLSEKQNIEVTVEFTHLPNYYEFEVPLEWEDYKTIRDNRTKAIGISLTDSGYVPLFIDQLDYRIMHASAKISGWTTEYLDISVRDDLAATQICMPAISDCEDAITDELGEMLTDEFGACITAS